MYSLLMYKSVYHVLKVLKVCKSVLLCMLPRLGMRQNSLIVNLTNNLSHQCLLGCSLLLF